MNIKNLIKMSKIIWISFFPIYFLTISNVLSQHTSYKFHYPLAIGDYWEYEERLQIFTLITTRQVIGDTIMPNGENYYIIENKNPLGQMKTYQRIIDSTLVYQLYTYRDSTDQIVYDEFLLYKLDLKVGDTWPYPPGHYDGFLVDSGFVEVTEIRNIDLFSTSIKSAFLSSYTLPDTGFWFYYDVVISDSIGMVKDVFEGGDFILRGAIINNKKYGIITSVKNTNIISDTGNDLLVNYPNPFNSSTTIEYIVNQTGKAKISIFNILGEKIKTFSEFIPEPGLYRINWAGDNEQGLKVASGVYFYLLEINGILTAKQKMTYLK